MKTKLPFITDSFTDKSLFFNSYRANSNNLKINLDLGMSPLSLSISFNNSPGIESETFAINCNKYIKNNIYNNLS